MSKSSCDQVLLLCRLEQITRLIATVKTGGLLFYNSTNHHIVIEIYTECCENDYNAFDFRIIYVQQVLLH